MKTINIAELKTHLSKYLRLVRNGERLVILDRRERIAEIVPSSAPERSPWQKWADAGLVSLGTQSFRDFSPLARDPTLDIQRLLHEVRED